MITEERFKVLQHIREYIFRVDASLENFPKKEIEIKVRIRENLYDLLEIAYEANMSSNVERKKELLEKSIAKVKVIDFLLNMSLDSFVISCVSVTGDAKENVNAVVEGKDLEIGFNPRYLMEALKVIEDDEIELNFTSNVLPLIIKPITGASYIYMVLPVKLKDE